MTTPAWADILVDLRAEDDVDRIVQAAAHLDAVADESHVPDLYRLIQDDDWFVREAAAVPLARLEGVRALPLLFRALTRGTQAGHDNDGLGSTIADVLEEHSEACAPLLVSMIADPDPELRAHAAWALGWQPPEIAHMPLLRAAQDSHAQVRASAAGSLSSFKIAGTMEALRSLLGDSDEQVRVSATAALGYLGDRRALPALQAALHDLSERVRSFAQYALEKLAKTEES
jgi:HEAT repeat protein